MRDILCMTAYFLVLISFFVFVAYSVVYFLLNTKAKTVRVKM